MIIESRKMIFFHIPKTGGNSVTSALIHYSDDQKLKKRKQDGVERFELRSALSRRKDEDIFELCFRWCL